MNGLSPAMRIGLLATLALGAGPVATAAALVGAAHTGGPGAPSTLYALCPDDGQAFAIGPIGFDAVGGMDFHPVTGELYAVAKRPDAARTPVLIVIDPLDAAGIEIGPLVNTDSFGGGGHFDLSFRDTDATLFLTAFHPGAQPPCVSLFTIDVTSGVATEIGQTLTCSPGNALGFDPTGKLFHADRSGGGTLYEVNQTTGTSTPVATLSWSGFPPLVNPRPSALEFAPGGGPAYLAVNDGSGGAGPNYLATLDPSTGEVTHVGTSVAGLDALARAAGGVMRFDRTVTADTSKTAFSWNVATDYEHVRGPFSPTIPIGAYVVDLLGSGSGSSLPAPVVPAEGEGAWYLLRLDCPSASWSSGGPGECPGEVCGAGGRDGALP